MLVLVQSDLSCSPTSQDSTGVEFEFSLTVFILGQCMVVCPKLSRPKHLSCFEKFHKKHDCIFFKYMPMNEK